MWSKKKPKDADSGMVFPGVQKSTWNYEECAKAYYFHRFYDFQPDLNTSNPEVQAEILKIMGFWLQLGVDGFRMDAVPFVIAQKGARSQSRASSTTCCDRSASSSPGAEGAAIILGEANVLPRTDLEYFGDSGERLQMMFNFEVNQHLFFALASGDSRPLVKAMQETKRGQPPRSGGSFCAITTNSTSDGSPRSSAQTSLPHSARKRNAAIQSRNSTPPRSHAAGRPPTPGTCL